MLANVIHSHHSNMTKALHACPGEGHLNNMKFSSQTPVNSNSTIISSVFS